MYFNIGGELDEQELRATMDFIGASQLYALEQSSTISDQPSIQQQQQQQRFEPIRLKAARR